MLHVYFWLDWGWFVISVWRLVTPLHLMLNDHFPYSKYGDFGYPPLSDTTICFRKSGDTHKMVVSEKYQQGIPVSHTTILGYPILLTVTKISEVSIVMGVPKMDGFQWKMPWKMPSINGWWLVVPQFQKPRNCQTSQEHRIWFELHTFSGHVMGSICTLFWNPWYLFTDLTSSIR